MIAQEAIVVLDQVAQEFKGNRADHVKIQEAMNVIQSLVAVQKNESEKADSEPKTDTPVES